MTAGAASNGTARQLLGRLVPVLVLVALFGAALGGFFVTRRAVDEQDRRALAERAATIEASLASTEQSIAASLRVLADLAASDEPSALSLFARVARDQLLTATGVGAAQLRGGQLRVVAGVGTLGRDHPLTGEEEALLRRALTARSFVATPLKAPPRLLLALAVDGVVVFEESSLVPAPSGQADQNDGLGDLDIALYSSPREQDLVFATARTPLHGDVTRRPLAVGADTWTLVVASDRPLVGSFTERVPWVVLGAGLLVAVLAGAFVVVLTRRRAYALRLVEQRTADLEQARQFQESLLLSGPAMVSRTRLPDFAVTYVSPNVQRILGVAPEEFTAEGEREDRVHPEDRTALEAAAQRVASGRSTSETVEFRTRAGDGSFRWVRDVLVPDRDVTTGAVVGLLSYVTDVEDQKAAESAMREAQEAAESANRAKSEFLSRMSHELRTPMNAVLGFGQLLEQDRLTPEQQESVGYIMRAGRHLLDLIDEILDIARIEAGRLSLSLEPVRVDRAVSETLDLLRPMAEDRGITLVHEPPPTEPWVVADHQRLKQILLNLLSNAVKYNSERGTVTVTAAETAAGKVRITVADTGRGISPEQRGLLFTPFQRLGVDQEDVEGTGIGLVLSRQLAEAMGGSLDLDTTGLGSRFWVELPAAKPDTARDGLDGAPRQRATEATGPLPLGYVLSIEDNPSNARLMERIVESRRGLELIFAGQGRLGVELARQHLPRIVLLDLHLPDIGGDEVLRRLRSDPSTASIPVVIVSADGTRGQESRLLELGAKAFLTKPLDIPRLLELIDEAVVVG